MAQHTQKRQQAELEFVDPREPFQVWGEFKYGPWEGEQVSLCPACGEEPAACDCDLHE